MRLNEITRSPSWDNSSVTVTSPSIQRIPQGARPFPGYADFVYYMSTAGSIGMLLGDFKVLSVIDTKNKKLAGKIYLSSADNVMPGALETSDLFVYDNYQKQGIAGNIYRLLTVDLGKIVFGDRNPEGGQTPEARRLWIKMAQGLVPEVVVKGYVVIDITTSNFENYVEDDVINAIMKLGGEWLYQDDRKWVVAFNTMPNQARSELISAIKTPLTGKIYINPERGSYSDLIEEAGLVAMSKQRFQALTGYQP